MLFNLMFISVFINDIRIFKICDKISFKRVDILAAQAQLLLPFLLGQALRRFRLGGQLVDAGDFLFIHDVESSLNPSAASTSTA